MMREIRTLDLSEITTLLDWAAAEGWNPGLSDARAFQAADPAGFIGAFVDGQMASAIAAVAYDAHFGFIGLYICHPDWRGQGHGRAVWDAGMAHLGDRTIGLDGVAEQQANYARMGFVVAYETVRMSGVLPPRPTDEPQRPAEAAQDIQALEHRCFPARRDGFLRHWVARPNQLVVRRRDGDVVGYAVARPCRVGHKIGPLFASDIDVAVDLITSQAGAIQIDVPTAQTAWLEALAKLGFTAGLRTRRMYRGTAPALNDASIFGVSSLELG